MNVKSLNDLEASLAVILSNVTAYYGGNLHAYRPVAVELRKLLCDTRSGSDNSLAERLFPRFCLHPLSGNQSKIDEFTALYIPGKIRFDNRRGSSLSALFNEGAATLPLDKWLQQKMFDASTTMKEFIRSVADKEAAHSDKSYNAILGKTKSVILSDDTLTAKSIVMIGRYFIKTLAIRMVNDNIADIGTYVLCKYDKVGRGAAVLNLPEFAVRVSGGVPIKYEAAPNIEAYFQHDVDKRTVARQILSDYQPSDYFLLLVVDLNSERWLYQLAIKQARQRAIS